MSFEIKNVLIVGGTGAVGKEIIKAITSSPSSSKFNISITSRPTSERPSWLSASVKIIPTEYASASAILAAVTGQDAVLSVLNFNALNLQRRILDASIEAGVKLFIPSDYGIDTSVDNKSVDKLAELYLWDAKIEFDKYLREKAAEGKIKWSAVYTNVLLDYGLKFPVWGFDLSTHTATIVNGGTKKISTTTITQCGLAIQSILSSPSLYINKGVSLATLTVSQLDVLAALEKATNKKWNLTHTTSKELIERGRKGLKEGETEAEISLATLSVLLGVVTDPEDTYAEQVDETDAKKLGVAPADLEEVVKSVL